MKTIQNIYKEINQTFCTKIFQGLPKVFNLPNDFKLHVADYDCFGSLEAHMALYDNNNELYDVREIQFNNNEKTYNNIFKIISEYWNVAENNK